MGVIKSKIGRKFEQKKAKWVKKGANLVKSYLLCPNLRGSTIGGLLYLFSESGKRTYLFSVSSRKSCMLGGEAAEEVWSNMPFQLV